MIPGRRRIARASRPGHALVRATARTALLAGIAAGGLAVLLPGAARAQDAFGSAVAVAGPDAVVVLKTGAARGPSQGRVFRWEGGEWVPGQSLPLLEGGFPGETLTPTLAVDGAGEVILLGAGDPGGALAGHLYLREGGEWRGAGRVLMDPTAAPPTGLPSSGLDMGTLMALMGPPLRAAVLDPGGAWMAVAGGELGESAARVLARDGDGWAVEAELAVPAGAPATGLGGSLDFDGDRILAGAPGMGAGGEALVWARDGDGDWNLEAVLSAGGDSGSGGPGSGALGSAVTLIGGGAALGDPDRDEVRLFRRREAGAWTSDDVLVPEADAPTGAGSSDSDQRTVGFGTSLAADPDHLAVGAPRADDRRGAVYLFRRQGADGWVPAGILAPEDLQPGDRFGTSVALAHGRLVVGAPGAYGDQGRAAVFDLSDLDAGPE